MLNYALAILVGLFTSSLSARDVLYPQTDDGKVEDSAIFKVLELALLKADGDWSLQPSPIGQANQKRRLAMLKEGSKLHVSWHGTSKELEETFNAVYFPIGGGLHGWRLLLINQHQQAKFSAVQTIEDLQTFTMGQGPGWADTAILEAAGFDVQIFQKKNLYDLVTRGRVDAFPRSLTEAVGAYRKYRAELPDLVIEESLVIRYPFANFFFTSPNQKDLAEAIQQGLERAHAEGSYQAIYFEQDNVKDILNLIGLAGRKVFQVDNPNVSQRVKNIPDRFWYHIDL